MSRMSLRVVVVALVLMGLQGQRVFGKVLVVGTCQGVKNPYTTIQSAVNNANPGDTVQVCPGTYPEQVSISVGITLKGIASGNQQRAMITVPGGGFTQNGYYYTTPVAAQVYVTSPGVTISDLVVDGTNGTGGQASPAYPACSPSVSYQLTAGILFHNVPYYTPGSADGGKIQHVVVRNEIDGCGDGLGIISDNSFIVIDSNDVRNVDQMDIVANGGQNHITSNSLIVGPMGYGIAVVGQSEGGALINGNTITGINGNNTITLGGNPGSPAIGIRIESDNGDSVQNNSISSLEAGIAVYTSQNELVQSNKITNTYWGLYVSNAPGGITNNGYDLNVINEATYGLLDINTNASDTIDNTYFNVNTIQALD